MKHKTKHTIKTMQKLAKAGGVKFISKTFLGSTAIHLWECAKGHSFPCRPYNIPYIKYGCCPTCSGKARLTVEQIKTIIESKEGKLLSEGFQRGKDYIKIECKKNHIWDTQVFNIRHGKWCPHCGGSFPLNINILKEVAEKRGGKCLTPEYTNANAWYLWQCSEGHTWKAKYGNIYSGNWCKKCSDSLGERICREFFEQLFNEKFTTAYPDWLVNDEGNNLELDGYCVKLKIAFEHQGNQHFKRTPLFTKDESVFKKRQEHDSIKRKLCFENGIYLIEVPEINKEIKISDIKDFIKSECLKKKIDLPEDFDKIEVDYNRVYKTPLWRIKLEKQKQIANSNGGECLSDTYISNDTKLKYSCKENHTWNATPAKIKLGRWCPKCSIIVRANKIRYTIEEMQELAILRNGKCLSTHYVSSHDKLLWECKEGHIWEAVPSSIVQKSWCPTCYRNRQKKISIRLVNNENQLKLKL